MDGVKSWERALHKVERAASRAAAAAMYAVANNIMSEAKELCPVDTGTLRSSGYVTLPTNVDNVSQTSELSLGFGGPASDYAVEVHENPTAYHPVGEMGYLRKACDHARSHFGSDVLALAKSIFEEGAVSFPKVHPRSPTEEK